MDKPQESKTVDFTIMLEELTHPRAFPFVMPDTSFDSGSILKDTVKLVDFNV